MTIPRRFWIGIWAAIVGAGLLLVVPTTRLESFWWGSDHPTGPDPFAFAVTLDTDEGTIVSDLEATTAISGNIAGLPFVVSGASGAGRVQIEARDPGGTLLVSELVGPNQGFRYPPKEDLVEFVSVKIDHPQQIPYPGGDVIFVLTATFPPDNLDQITVTGIGVEPYSMDDLNRLDSGRLDSCANLELPFTLLRAGVMRCTYSLQMTGGVGEVFEVVPFVETVDGTWSAQPGFVEIVPVEAQWPEPPPLVSGTPGYAAAPQSTRGGIFTAETGRYVITATAPEGSAGFEMWLNAERSTRHFGFSQISPIRQLGLGFIAAALTGLLMGTAASPPWRRFAGLPLLAAALAVPVALVASGDHDWYWQKGTHLIWLVALALAVTGGSLLAEPGRPIAAATGSPRTIAVRIGQLALILLGIGTAGLAALTSPSYGGSFLGGEAPGSYTGDYIFMGVHIFFFEVAVPFVALAAAAATRLPHTGGVGLYGARGGTGTLDGGLDILAKRMTGASVDPQARS